MSRLRLVAIAVLVVVAAAAGLVALVLHGTSGSGADGPVALSTPSDVRASLAPQTGVTTTVGTLEQSGFTRSYLVIAPSTLAPSVPLIVGLHGRNATPGEEATRSGLLPYVAAGQAVLVYPVGYQQAWNVGDGCCGLGVSYDLDDVAFVGEVVDTVRATLGLTGPTDVVGYSNGGRLAFTLACRDVDRYDAVVAMSATPPATDCPQATRPVSVFLGLLSDDDELPSAEDPEPVDTLLPDIENALTTRDVCTTAPTGAAAGRATVTVWPTCADGTVVQVAQWQAEGHHYPEEQYVGRPDAADLIWSFLAGVHTRAAAG